jgi:small-conductance mechanosensitive channel
VGTVAVLGVFTEQWLGVLVSLGVVGFAVTFALQQPLLSLIAWVYIMTARPYAVGDRIEVGGARAGGHAGDVIAVDFLVTTLWEIDGGLVSTNQPSGRVVTVPNSVVLSSEVTNFGGAGIPHVWNELAVQVAYETDLAFARETMIEVADGLLGDEMAARIAEYREELAETPVELEVQDRPTVNVVQKESWVELRLRYLVHPRRGTRVRNELYRRILDRFNEHPDRVDFPVGRNR